mmetsp:Transcript_50801/g.163057  ORF Transcript_50801/g.163057 Transcript_50801/m.163057 type:complete len:142 (-) Transcript_50801:67-492(-)
MSAAESKGCLCLFDIDRVLTAKPGCPGSRVVAGVYDNAYGGGPMTLSALGQGIGQTACGRCALGAVSAGSGGSGAMQSMLRGVDLQDVYFFDDKASAVGSFRGSGMNAHQVSCASRDVGGYGLCGATPGEVSLTRGISNCR